MQDVAEEAARDYVERASKRELLDRLLDAELPRRSVEAARSVIFLHLELEDLLHVAQWKLGVDEIRDVGLLESAWARPRSTVCCLDAYASIHLKAAALLHSIARNHSPGRRQQAARSGGDHRLLRPERASTDPGQRRGLRPDRGGRRRRARRCRASRLTPGVEHGALALK